MNQSDTFKIAPGGFQGGFQGAQYQIKLLQLFALKALKIRDNFKIWTEDESADKFDDLLLSYNSGNQTRFTFLQAKHRVNEMTFQLSTLFNDKNYNLYKYYKSFEQIEDNFQIDYKINDIDDLIISTNNIFPKFDKICELTKDTPHGKFTLQFKQIEKHEIFTNEGILFKFDEAKEIENCEFLKMKFLSIELAQLLFDGKSKLFLLNHCKDFLVSQIFDISEKTISFKDEFLNPQNAEMDTFRLLFKEAIENDLIKIGNERKTKFLANPNEFLKKLKLNKNLIETIEAFDTNSDRISAKLKLYLHKILFVTETKESTLDRNISLEILSFINDSSQFGDAMMQFQDYFEKWLNPSKEGNSSNTRTKLCQAQISEIFASILDKNILRKSYEFSGFSQNLKDFFSSTSKSLTLIYEAAKYETFWCCLKNFSFNNSIIFMNSDVGNFDKILETFKNSSKQFCLVVEVKGEADTKELKNFMENFRKESNAKLVIVCEGETSKTLSGDLKIVEVEILCGQLAEKSFNLLLQKSIKFQGVAVPLKELIEIDQLKNISLKVIENFEGMGTAMSLPEIYLARKLSRKDYMKPEALESLKNEIVFEEIKFESRLKGNIPTHLFEKLTTTQDIIWKKSSHSIKSLRRYVDDSKSTQMTDESFLQNLNQVNIIKDVPGMGKSVFMTYLASELKQKHENCWVQMFELQTCIDELEKFEVESTDDGDVKEVLNFFIEEFVKLAPNSLEKKIVENSFSGGNVIFLFDGFDEIQESQKKMLLKIIARLQTVSKDNKFYISTRPEWAEHLEDHLIQISYFFEPFTTSDQENFLLKYWKKDSTWRDVAQNVLKKLNKSITDREKSFTGIPLMTRLVGDFFIGKLDDEKQMEDSLLSNLSFYDLMNFFVNRKFEIFLIAKSKLNKNQQLYKKQLKSLKQDHIKLALHLIFGNLIQDLIPPLDNLDQDAIDEFVRYGLVQLINGKLKFIHQTIAEFFATLYFIESFEKPKILEFLFKVVLVENGYQMIRFLLNFVIEDAVNNQNIETLANLAKENSDVLYVAAKESNTNTFEALLVLIDEGFLRDLLLEKYEDGILLYHYFLECEVKNTELLDKIYNEIRSENFKNILRTINRLDDETVLLAAGQQGKNYLLLTRWILKNFSDDLDFIKEVILASDHFKGNILRMAVVWEFNKLYFMEFLKLLKSFENQHQIDLLSDLVLQTAKDSETFLYHLIFFLKYDETCSDNAVDILIEVLEWIRDNTKFFEELIQIGDTLVLHQVVRYFKTSINKFVKFLCSSADPNKILLNKNEYGKAFHFEIYDPSILKSLFECILENFPDFDMRLLMNAENYKNENILFHLVNEQDKFEWSDFCALLDWIKLFDSTLFRSMIILHEDFFDENLLRHSFCYGFKNILNLINYLETNIPEFDWINFFNETDRFGNNILFYFFCDEIDVSIQILDWIKKIDFNLWQDFIFHKNKEGATFIHKMCRGYKKKLLLPQIFKRFNEYFESNALNFITLLSQRDNLRNTFINQIFFKNQRKAKLDAAEATCEILKWLSEINFDLMTDLVYNKDKDGAYFIYDVCKESESSKIGQMFKAIIQCLLDIVPDLNLIEYLNNKNVEGKTCFDILIYDEIRESVRDDIENWLQNLGYFLKVENGIEFLAKIIPKNNEIDERRGTEADPSQNVDLLQSEQNFEILKENEEISENEDTDSGANQNIMHSMMRHEVKKSNPNSNEKVDQKIPEDVSIIDLPVDDEIENQTQRCFCRFFCFAN